MYKSRYLLNGSSCTPHEALVLSLLDFKFSPWLGIYLILELRHFEFLVMMTLVPPMSKASII